MLTGIPSRTMQSNYDSYLYDFLIGSKMERPSHRSALILACYKLRTCHVHPVRLK